MTRILTVSSLQIVCGLMIYANVLVGSVPLHQGQKIIFQPSMFTSIIRRFPVTTQTYLLVVTSPSNVAIRQPLMVIVQTVMTSHFLFPMLYLNFIANIPASISRSTCPFLRSWELFMWKVLLRLMLNTLFHMELLKEQYSLSYWVLKR